MSEAMEKALNLPACERLRDFVEVGPAQRAALEAFADALRAELAAPQEPVARNAPEVLCAQCGNPSMNAAPICYRCANKAAPAAEQGVTSAMAEAGARVLLALDNKLAVTTTANYKATECYKAMLAAAQEGKQWADKQLPNGVTRQDVCVWVQDSDGPWNTSCGKSWEFIEGGPTENEAHFCHHCGGVLLPQPFDGAQEGKPAIPPLMPEGWIAVRMQRRERKPYEQREVEYQCCGCYSPCRMPDCLPEECPPQEGKP